MVEGNSLGINVWWHVPEITLDGPTVQTVLRKHGFAPDAIKLPSRKEVVSRGAFHFQQLHAKEFNRRKVEAVFEDTTRKVYGLLRWVREADEEVAFEQDTTITLNKGTGEVTAEGELATEALAAVQTYSDKILAEDIRCYLTWVIGQVHGIAKRPSGGIYFVPAVHAHLVQSAKKVLEELNTRAKLYVEGVVNGEQERQNVWDSVEDEVRGELAKVVSSVNMINKRVSAVADQEEKVKGLKELMSEYQRLLGTEAKYEGLAAEVEDVVKMIANKMTVLQSGSPVARNNPATPSVVVVAPPVSSSVVIAAMNSVSNAPVLVHVPVEEGRHDKWLEAAEQILREAQTPLHYRAITVLALGKKLVETTGKTPENSIGAALSRSQNVVKLGKGMWALK